MHLAALVGLAGLTATLVAAEVAAQQCPKRQRAVVTVGKRHPHKQRTRKHHS
ncbi:MAG: hypothetical protein AAF267_23935 [Deinococcota bacterium]